MAYTGTANADFADSLTPPEIAAAVLQEIEAQSAFAAVSTRHATSKDEVTFPIWKGLTEDPTWLTELQEIPENFTDSDEVTVRPAKTATILLVSNELAADGTPDALNLIGKSIGKRLADAVDVALIKNATTTNGPDGLLSTTPTAVDTGASVASLDPFIAAIFAAEAHGAKVSHWLTSPAQAEAWSKIRTQTGSNENLLQLVESGLSVAGRPVIVSKHVDAATKFWAIDRTQVQFVVRQDVQVTKHEAITVDGKYLRGVGRFSAAYLNEVGIVRGYDAP